MRLLLFVILCGIFTDAYPQYSTRKVLKKKQAYTDSIKQVKYDYHLPFLGQQVYKAGFDIPYPIGIMANYVWMDQGLTLTDMQLGLKSDNQDIPLTNVDEFLSFQNNKSEVTGFNIRPDVWLFPFLNVYGIVGFGQSTTSINLIEPLPLSSSVEQSVRTAGFGLMGPFGIGPVWMSIDANWSWTKPELLEKAVRAGVLGIRLGKTFTFNNRPDRNIAVWIGAFRMKLASETSGEIRLIDALPPDVWDRRDQIVSDYYEWYNGLPPIIQARVDQTPLPDIVERIESADGDAIIRYGMQKQVAEKWNGIFGLQYQMNKRWMLRTEFGVIGDRKSAMGSLNYRFLW